MQLLSLQDFVGWKSTKAKVQICSNRRSIVLPGEDIKKVIQHVLGNIKNFFAPRWQDIRDLTSLSSLFQTFDNPHLRVKVPQIRRACQNATLWWFLNWHALCSHQTLRRGTLKPFHRRNDLRQGDYEGSIWRLAHKHKWECEPTHLRIPYHRRLISPLL